MQDRLSRRNFLGATGAAAPRCAANHGRATILRDSAHLFEKPT